MGFIFTTIKTASKLTTKLVLAGGTVYGANYYGFFGSYEESKNAYKSLKSDFNEVLPQYIPKEALEPMLENAPEIPKVDLSEIVPIEFSLENATGTPSRERLWNRGVLATFNALANSPSAMSNYSQDFLNFLKDQMNTETSEEETAKKTE